MNLQKETLGMLGSFLVFTLLLCLGAIIEAKLYRHNAPFSSFKHSKRYPEDYILPHRRIRKLFRMKHEMIPKWMYVRLLLVFLYVGVFLISSIIVAVVMLAAVSEVVEQTMKILWCFYLFLFAGSIVHYFFCILRNADYKKMKKELQEAFNTKNKHGVKETIRIERQAKQFLKEQENKKKR